MTPNPAPGVVEVRFSLPRRGSVSLTLVDVGGRIVESAEPGSLGPGDHSIRLGDGSRLAPGYYVVRLRQGSDIATRPVMIVR